MDTSTFNLILVVVLAILCLVLGFLWYQQKKRAESAEQANKTLKVDMQKVQDKAAPLWKYQKIADAKQEADRLISTAKAQINEAMDKTKAWVERKKQAAIEMEQAAENEALKIKQAAQDDAEVIRIEARNNTNEAKEKADSIVASAQSNADNLIAIANKRAQEIAGSAMEAMGKADLFEQKAKAMKNLIDGYGDEYLVANKTLLDDLAEEFNHKDGGVELAKARLLTKTLAKNQRAADCDYVEANRKETAIRFVLDAFNGKVDTALSKIKHDNYGKLEQEIKDAFGLVNGHGQAFRGARITEEYLMARLSELKWGVVTLELKLQEREEQRRIKEEIREEEKARREYEKAIREAEKEERMLQQAMEKARQQMAGATEEQRLKYEEQLAELQAKYDEAEAKNQRALSMAQQTRRGHVYVISNVGSFGEHVYKIGLTRRLEPLDRVKELGDASVPFSFDVHAMLYAEDAPTLENELHRHFESEQMNKVNPRKEFFKTTLKEIKQVVEDRGIEAHWTMMAEAREYLESIALERRMNQDEGERFSQEADMVAVNN